MICTFTVGGVTVDLAGGQGQASETSGYSTQLEPNFQRVTYAQATEGRQFFRGGTMLGASFSAMVTLGSVSDATAFINNLNDDLKDQTDATVTLADRAASGIKQVETATIATAPTGAGNALVTVTAASIVGSPVVVTVPLLGTENQNQTAIKIVAALNANTQIRKRFVATHGSPSINLTATRAAANDATLNIAIANGSPSPGLTAAPTSANTTAGVADTLTNVVTLYDASAIVGLASMGATVALNVSLLGRTSAP